MKKSAMCQMPARIETEADLAAGQAVLMACDARFAPILAATGPLPLRRQPDGFGALLAYYGAIAAASFGSRMLISVDLPMALFRYAMPLGGALIALVSLTRLAGLLTGQVDPDDLLPESDA